jgi:hypothetical protein
VSLPLGVAWAAVVSVLADDDEAALEVRAAVAGDKAAVERLEDWPLDWYDVTEAPALVERWA